MLFHRKAQMLAVLLTLVVCFGGTVSAQPTERCFPETGQCIAGPIRAYSERNLTRTRVELGGSVYWHVSSLSATQRHILDLYDRLAEAEPNSLPNVRE